MLSCLYLFFIAALAMLLLFRGMFPLFGTFLFGIQGMILLDATMACLACLIIGTLPTARLGLVGLGHSPRPADGLNGTELLRSTGFAALVSALAFPETEMAFMRKIRCRAGISPSSRDFRCS